MPDIWEELRTNRESGARRLVAEYGNRLYAAAILPQGKSYTFWGRGVSQGHSDAIRRVEGVQDGKQYTIPVPADCPCKKIKQLDVAPIFARAISHIHGGTSIADLF